MTIDAWLTLVGITAGIVGFLIRHAINDGRVYQRVADLEKRLAKLDGIKNGS